MLRLKFGGYVRPLRPEPLEVLAAELNDLDFCYAVLNKVSRSFAVVIQQLPKQLQDPVCIFYLVRFISLTLRRAARRTDRRPRLSCGLIHHVADLSIFLVCTRMCWCVFV